MKSKYKPAIALLAGVAIGAAAIHGLHAQVKPPDAQVKPPAYFFAEIDVNDPEAYRAYVDRNTPVVNDHGGRFLARGGNNKTITMDGDPPKRIVKTVTRLP